MRCALSLAWSNRFQVVDLAGDPGLDSMVVSLICRTGVHSDRGLVPS
jgi:hypothetical protein